MNIFITNIYNFITSSSSWVLVLILYVSAFIFGLLYRAIFINLSMVLLQIKLIKPSSNISEINHFPNKNIGKIDRLFRLIISLILLVWAIFLNWNPVLIFLSGFCLFEAVFSWCAFYAVLDKNTCTTK